MRTVSRLVLTISVGLLGMFLLAASRAAETAPEAKIVKIVTRGGAPTVTINGETEPAREQMAIPVNAVIETAANQEVYLEVATGVVASIRPGSRVAVATLNATDSVLELRQGQLVSQIDKNRPNKRSYGVKVGNGVAAARGTSFTVTNDVTGFSITTTADGVQFVSPAGTLTIQAGQYTFTPAGATQPNAPVSLVSAASDPQVAAIVRDAVSTAATVVQNNLGSISADAATNIMAQVVSVAVSALPTEATSFTSTAVVAVTAPGSATAGSTDMAAGAITAAAVSASPTQAAQIAAAAAAAAPAQAGVIVAAAQQVAPAAKEAIADQVATSTGQTPTTVQSSADSSSASATKAVETAKDATSNVVAPTPASPTPPATTEPQSTDQKTTETQTTPVTPVDPTLNVSPAT